MEEVGRVEEGMPESVLIVDGREQDFTPRFRESAYTPVKKVVDRRVKDFETMKRGVDHAAEAALEKKRKVLARLRSPPGP
jgi:hydrogenase expression/formation protein